MAKLPEQRSFHHVAEYLVTDGGEQARVQVGEFGRAFGAQLRVAAVTPFEKLAGFVGGEEFVVHCATITCAARE